MSQQEKPCEQYKTHQAQIYQATIAFHTNDNERHTTTLIIAYDNYKLHQCCIKNTIEQAYMRTNKTAIVTSLEPIKQPTNHIDILITK